MPTEINIWPGSGSFTSGSGYTPYGFYDNDLTFKRDIVKAADWAGRRLGHYIQDVELIDKHFFAAYEEAVNEYGYYVNTYAARDNLLTVMGLATGSLNLSQTYIKPNSNELFSVASDYATAVGVGGTLTHYTGSILLEVGKQTYDLKSLPTSSLSLETGSFNGNEKFTIRKIYHGMPPAITRYFDPMVQSGLTSDGMLGEFGWGSYSPGVHFVIAPIYWDALRLQAIEFNDIIRKSAYTFSLVNDRLKIFPIPKETYRVWFEYTLEGSDIASQITNPSNADKISGYSDIPYGVVKYSKVNDIGKNWIRNYFLAICKETLGRIRGKYSSIPIPDNEISLNYSDLLQEAQQEKEALRTELKEYLDSFTKEKQLERKVNEANFTADYLKYVPLKIYVG